MNIEMLIQKDAVLTVANKLFTYTDARNWQGILDEVFAGQVFFDMTSLAGGQPATLAATAITAAWQEGLEPIEAIHHQTGNFDVDIEGDKATVTCYATAWHYKQTPSGRNTRVFVGTYVLQLVKLQQGWRINSFTFNKKFIDGNLDLA